MLAGRSCRNKTVCLDKVSVIIHLTDVFDLVIKSKTDISHKSLLPVDHDLLISRFDVIIAQKMQQGMSDEEHCFALKRMTVALSLNLTSCGINENVTITEHLVAVFISLKIAAVRNLNELAFS